jgi:hypothetical protein
VSRFSLRWIHAICVSVAVFLCMFGFPTSFFGRAVGQTLTVTASVGAPTPAPAMLGETVTAALNATLANPPSSYPPPSGPYWSWSVSTIQYAATQSNAWGSPPTGATYTPSISQPNPSSPAATFTGVANTAGYWLITLQVTATYKGGSGTVVAQASDKKPAEDVRVTVAFSPNPLYVAEGGTAQLTATLTPPDAAGVTYASKDPTIASVPPVPTLPPSP